MEESTRRRLVDWFAGVRNLGSGGYAAGKVLDLSLPSEQYQWSGPEETIRKLYVRKEFSSLFASIITATTSRRWLVHLNGNPGIGKSAFLWYFLIRYANEKKGAFSILYQSGDFIWEFDSSGMVSVDRKFLFPTASIAKAHWHLVNQKVTGEDVLGRRILVAASEPSNVKPAAHSRMLAVRYMFPWDKDEFDCLVNLWKAESLALATKASGIEAWVAECESQRCTQAFEAEPDGMEVDEAEITLEGFFSEEEERLEGDADLLIKSAIMAPDAEKLEKLKLMASAMKKQAAEMDVRVAAADTFFSWFGGAPRRLWQLEENKLTEAAMEMMVDAALLKTDLTKVYQMMLSGAVSWSLVHFKRPTLPGAKYNMEFASAKIKYKFVSVLGNSKAEDLKTLLYSAGPEFASLRGFIFEQEVVRKVLHGQISADVMVDNKHCANCNDREDIGDGPVKWIACDACDQWYHQQCVNLASDMILYKWKCEGCPGKLGKQPLSPVGQRRLKYYETDLNTALFEAGHDAIKYVFRPLRKNNAAFDFAFLPNTLGRATAANHRHYESYEAVKEGYAALKAWNEAFNPDSLPEVYLLVFFLTRINYPEFGFQSYRNSRGSVSRTGVKGIVQAKVLVSVYDEEQPKQRVDIPQPGLVEKIEDLVFEDIDYESMTVEQLRDLARETGFRGYSSLKKAALINGLRTWINSRATMFESRQLEKDFFENIKSENLP